MVALQGSIIEVWGDGAAICSCIYIWLAMALFVPTRLQLEGKIARRRDE